MQNLSDSATIKISAHIRKTLPGCVIINCKKIGDPLEGTCYLADVVKDDIYHHMKFTEAGDYISEEIEPQFSDGYHEQYF